MPKVAFSKYVKWLVLLAEHSPLPWRSDQIP